MPSRLIRRSSFRTDRNGAKGSGRSAARSSVEASLTTALWWREPSGLRPCPASDATGRSGLRDCERTGPEEVLANVAERPLDLAFGFGAVRPTRLRMETIVAGKINEGTVVDDAAGIAPITAVFIRS